MMSLLSIVVLFEAALGHTIISVPEPRDKTTHGYNNQECGTSRQVKHTWQRGQRVDLEWARNNHQGGFVQYSVMPLSSSDPNRDIDEFEDPQNIIYVTCYDKPTCLAQGGGDDFGTGGDGMAEWSNICKDTLTIPDYLEDGDYVMKSTVYGNGDSYGIRNMAHPTYGNCHNFRVSGGNSLVSKPSNSKHIKWNLEDLSIDRMNSRKGWNIPQGQCMFLGSNRHNDCSCRNGCSQSGRNPKCTGAVAAISRCGKGRDAESWDECGGGKGGDELYNYMVGLPMVHPDFTGKLTMLSHVRDTKVVQIDVPKRSGSPGPSPGNAGSDGNGGEIFLIGSSSQTVVSMWSVLPLMISATMLLNR
jgi:hypothetical protein